MCSVKKILVGYVHFIQMISICFDASHEEVVVFEGKDFVVEFELTPSAHSKKSVT